MKQGAPHHSKEVPEEEEEEEERHTQTSPEQKELQMIARRRHEEKRGSEEEGSASRKSEVSPFLLQPAGKLLHVTLWFQIRINDLNDLSWSCSYQLPKRRRWQHLLLYGRSPPGGDVKL